MGPIRLFLRGVSRMITRAVVRRSISRVAVRGLRGARGGSSRTMNSVKMSDDLADEVSSQLDVLEVLEIAAELPSILNDARQAAAAEGAAVWEAPMGGGLYNKGQEALVQQYCVDYTTEYWSETDEPDLDMYLTGLYSQHEAIEQALSETAEQSYEAARSAGLMVLAQAMAAYVAESVVSRALDVNGARMSDWNSSQWDNFAADMAMEQTNARAMLRSGNVPDHLRMKVMPNGRIDTMVINDKGKDIYGATRQLSWGQFMGSDQPYWFTEQRRMFMAHAQGHMTRSEFDSKKQDLYRRTYRDPWNTQAPSGYRPYNGPEFSATPQRQKWYSRPLTSY